MGRASVSGSRVAVLCRIDRRGSSSGPWNCGSYSETRLGSGPGLVKFAIGRSGCRCRRKLRMTPEKWRRARDLFEIALTMPEPERAGFVRKESARDSELRVTVLEMLDGHQDSGAVD